MTSQIKTVRRNTKRFAAIFAQATRAISFHLNDDFNGRDLDLAYVRATLPVEIDKFDAKVRDNGDGKFTVRYHSNHWVEIASPA